MDRFRIEYESLQDIIKSKDEQLGILRAKYFLDVLEFKVNLVPEYPDMV